ncbi:nucleotidyltransferase domain-containing protein [Thermodesulfovibrio sp. 3907-1M]|uniref:Nucleotidyltransferase domain-containing protein n=1 Tax=Thermodesulfovibrio autotrophicus TaxID=3118333 RepID=A0AAU8GUV7_9BACT
MKKAQKIKKIPYLNYYEDRFINELIEKIKNLYPNIKKIILYGSKARGDFLEDSDIDLLFVVEKAIDKKTKFLIYDLISELEIKYTVLVSVVFACEEDFKTKKINFLSNIKKEGILLWLRE